MDEEDYEISSPNVQEYLSQFNDLSDHRIDHTSQINPPEAQEKPDTVPEVVQTKQSVQIDQNQLLKLLSRIQQSSLLYDLHIEFLNDLYLSSNKSSNRGIYGSLFTEQAFILTLAILFFHPIFSTLLVLFALSHSWLVKRLVVVLFDSYISNLVIGYQTIAKDLHKYLKQAELVSLSSQREQSIRKQNSVDFNLTDQLNFKYRKEFFLANRDNYFSFIRFNQQFQSRLDQIDIKLVCGLESDDSASIFNLDESVELATLTDQYSLECASSMLKLNRLVISENIQLVIVSLITRTSSIELLQLGFQLYQLYKRQLKSLKRLENILKLKTIDISPINLSDGKKSTAALNLALYLRNALLNAQDLREETISNDISLIKKNMEHAQMYLDQIELSLEARSPHKHQQVLKEEIEPSEESQPTTTSVPVDYDYLIEDEIFEAEVKTDEKPPTDTQGDVLSAEDLLREKENAMMTKNLFYELKYALKFKSNEWSQRERSIRRVDKHKQPNNELSLDSNDHLLDNNAYKYKAGLKRSKKLFDPNKVQHVKIEEKKRKYVYEESEPKETVSFLSSQFMSDLISRRQALQQNENEEVFGDQD